MILYIQTAFLGDLLLSIPTLKRLKELYPKQKIHLLCRKNHGDFFNNEGLVDEVYDQFQRQKPNLLEAHQLFSKKKFDLVICPHQSLRSSILLMLLSSKKKISFSNFLNSQFCHETSYRPMNLPETIRQMSLLKMDEVTQKNIFDFKDFSLPFTKIPEWSDMTLSRFKNKDEFKIKLKKKLNSDKDIICVAPGSVWPTKRWSVQGFSEVCNRLSSEYQIVCVGSAGEKEVADELQKLCPSLKNLTGQTNFTELAEALAGSELLLANDSGAMHMASVTSTPTVSVFGPTVLTFGYQPWNSNAVVIENKGLGCRPCSSHGSKLCPIGTHECMSSITGEQVYSQAKKLLRV